MTCTVPCTTCRARSMTCTACCATCTAGSPGGSLAADAGAARAAAGCAVAAELADVDRGTELGLEVLLEPVQHALLELARALAADLVAIADLLQRERLPRQQGTELKLVHAC